MKTYEINVARDYLQSLYRTQYRDEVTQQAIAEKLGCTAGAINQIVGKKVRDKKGGIAYYGRKGKVL